MASDKWQQSEYADYLQTCVYLYNFPVNDYNREILCNAYVEGTVDTYATTISRSMAGVALLAQNDGDARAEKYIKEYNVNFYGEDCETEIEGLESIGVKYGSLIDEPEAPADTPTKAFVGWYSDADCTTAFDFTQPVTGTTNIYSKWEEKYVPPIATTVSINGGTVTSNANFT
ncbi:MAG: InlB B-repeat-containing protein, partial [Candidatus Scatosoma sp.]